MNSRFFVQAANTAGCLADRQNWSVILVARAWLCILVLVVASLTAASGFGQPPSSSPAAARRQSVPAAGSTPAASVAARSRAPALGPVEGSSFQLPVEFAAPRMASPFSTMSPGLDPTFFSGEVHDPWRVWARAEYLLWWVEGMSTPPLITSSPDGTSRDLAGVLGQDSTTILYGGESLIDSMRPGGRFSAGYWFDWSRFHGVEATFLGLASRDSTFQAHSSGSPILARPFTNIEPGFEGPDAELVAFPGVLTGRIESLAESSLLGVEVLYRGAWWQVCENSFDFLAGWRYLNLDERLRVGDFKTSIDTSPETLVPVGTTLDELDSFTTKNYFNGVEIGLLAHTRRKNWRFEVLGKLAFGNTRSKAIIDGTTTITVPGEPPSTTDAGLLAQQTNMGTYQRDVFSVVPEFGLTAGYHLTPNVHARVGYTFIYWNRVARPGDQIDTSLNLSQLEPTGLVGPARPAFNWVDTGMWIQGISLGLEGRF
jgi:hypothetical protein